MSISKRSSNVHNIGEHRTVVTREKPTPVNASFDIICKAPSEALYKGG
jgi:hypothetical protein